MTPEMTLAGIVGVIGIAFIVSAILMVYHTWKQEKEEDE